VHERLGAVVPRAELDVRGGCPRAWIRNEGHVDNGQKLTCRRVPHGVEVVAAEPRRRLHQRQLHRSGFQLVRPSALSEPRHPVEPGGPSQRRGDVRHLGHGQLVVRRPAHDRPAVRAVNELTQPPPKVLRRVAGHLGVQDVRNILRPHEPLDDGDQTQRGHRAPDGPARRTAPFRATQMPPGTLSVAGPARSAPGRAGHRGGHRRCGVRGSCRRRRPTASGESRRSRENGHHDGSAAIHHAHEDLPVHQGTHGSRHRWPQEANREERVGMADASNDGRARAPEVM
jgi:hypothetical protein